MMDSTADGEATTAAKTEPEPAVAPRIDRCGAKSGGPLLLKCDEPAVIAVDVSGRPAADVGWHVAGRRVRKSSRYRPSVSGRRHTLTVLRVTDELEKGVWVMASNSAGEDSCLIAVKTYRVLTGLPNSFHDSIQNIRRSVMLNRLSTQRPFSPETKDLDVTSPTRIDWTAEMEIRNRMRSVDDLMYYGTWKRQSLVRARRHDGGQDAGGGGGVSLNHSYSVASVATDDEVRLGSQRQPRHRSLRLRCRSTRTDGSIVSAPPRRPISLDDSVGSAALDVDSMFRVFAATTPAVADNEICSPTAKPEGLPPSGVAVRTTSARRTSQRRRRRPKDAMNGSSETVSSSFDDAQMTSSTIDLKDATTAAVVPATTEPQSLGVDRSKPVNRSPRRRRRPNQSPSPSASQDLPVTSTTTTAATDVGEPEALWELCGEKLNSVCQRILNIDVAETSDAMTEVTSPKNKTDPAHTTVEVVQPSDSVQGSPPCAETNSSPVSERRRGNDDLYSVDLNSYRPSIIPDEIQEDPQQPASQSLDGKNKMENSCHDAENEVGLTTDIDSSVLVQHHGEISELLSREPTSPTDVAVPEIDRNDSVESPADSVPPPKVELDAEQFHTETYSQEQCLDRPESEEEAIISNQRKDVCTPVRIEEDHAADAVDVPHQLNDGGTSSIVEERPGSPRVDISAMLAPSVELQDILDTIYTLTGGGADGASLTLSAFNSDNRINDEDETRSPSSRGALLPENATSGHVNGDPGAEDDFKQLPNDGDDVDLVGHSAAVRLDRADDEEDDSSLDLDADDYGLSAAAVADFAASLHLAIAEDDDDDDLDIAHKEYELDDEVL